MKRLIEGAARIQAFDGVERVGQASLIILRGAQIVGIARFVQLARELLDVFDLRVQRRHFIGGQTARLGGQSLHDVADFESGFVNRAQLVIGDGFVEFGFGRFDFRSGRFGRREVGLARHRIRRCCIGRHRVWDGFIGHRGGSHVGGSHVGGSHVGGSHVGGSHVGGSRRVSRAADEGDAQKRGAQAQ